MKNKAPLSLMEQLVMLLVFALAAVLCLQVYVLSGQVSRHCEVRDQAVTLVQNTAESVKASRGDASQYPRLLGGSGDADRWCICYDEDWKQTAPETSCYRLLICAEDTGLPTLGRASVSAMTESGEPLFSVAIAWQEVAP